MNWHIFDAKAKSLRCKSLSMTTFGDRLSNWDIVRGIPILYSLMAFSILRFLHIVENFSDEADELLLSNAQWVKSMFKKYTGCLRVSVQGVKSLWGDCRFIQADWGS